jgi:mannonate dehydratase
MIATWRWFGPTDPITLTKIKQAGATGIVSALHDMATGQLWPEPQIREYKNIVEQAGLTWEVVESVPVHNDIKTRSGNYKELIANYITSLENLAKNGVYTVCYNFMPVVDWTRTNLSYSLPDNSKALRFEMTDFAAYDVHMLTREGAEKDYSKEILDRANERFSNMSEHEKVLLEKNIIAGLPGGEGSYDSAGIKAEIKKFTDIGEDNYRQNLFAFLQDVIPAAQELGIKMCIHPDDPPFTLFGLPRVVSTADDAKALLDACPSEANGLTMCAGSYGARGDNDLVDMVHRFGERIYFVHLRNVKRESDGSFYESEHLNGDNDMVALIDALLTEERRRMKQNHYFPIPMRPDHGHELDDEQQQNNVKPGYSYMGRLKGLAELRGVIHTMEYLHRR